MEIGIKKPVKMERTACHCGSEKNYEDCCFPFLSGRSKPETPEQLMRSRYSAFCTHQIEYLISTCHPSQPPEQERVADTCQNTQWLGLKVLKTEKDLVSPDIGYVEFVAFYESTGPGQLHEKSKFIHENSQWYYVDGVVLAPLTFGRNEPCWCGSRKKYKRCHGR